MSFGSWLGDVLCLLRRNFSAWRWRPTQQGAGMRIRFADASAVLCAPSATEIIREGVEAQRFVFLRSLSPEENQTPEASLEMDEPGTPSGP
ncbi:hypothetical protein [Paenirhodobacter populi]|uniref:Uncharacterized protein n=1 Tax=Paenirhodobacter populi TaxID=2306993 RepID=A0A443J7M9_9RHOB|nr:hypothetical protein [Sinirhodobacter populi]RWR16496.1 hypothetical protein D2T30_21490 [Sinirhodobacter populi]